MYELARNIAHGDCPWPTSSGNPCTRNPCNCWSGGNPCSEAGVPSRVDREVVLEYGLRPVRMRRQMARFAGRRESGGTRGWDRSSSCSWRRGTRSNPSGGCTLGMARGAIQRPVRALEDKELAVSEIRPRPIHGPVAVAGYAIGREAGGFVIRVVRPVIIREMAADAIVRRPGIPSVRMAGRTCGVRCWPFSGSPYAPARPVQLPLRRRGRPRNRGNTGVLVVRRGRPVVVGDVTGGTIRRRPRVVRPRGRKNTRRRCCPFNGKSYVPAPRTSSPG